MNDNTNVVTFLSLGPGDPELLTLKAARLLREADVIILPGTVDADGNPVSRAAAIVMPHCNLPKVLTYQLPMQRDRTSAHAVYDDIVADVQSFYRQGRRVVIAVEGDVSIYASIHYVLERLQAAGIPVSQQPGIPSFIAAAARAGVSLASQQQRLVVLPGSAEAALLHTLLDSGHVVVVMKLSQCQDTVKDFLCTAPSVVVHYFEEVGTLKEYYTCDLNKILTRPFPYFSLIILKPVSDK